MTLDRYTRVTLTVIALALGVIALRPWMACDRWLQTIAPQAAEAQRRKEIAVPAAWGKVVGFSDGYALFEASDGTLRQVGLGSGTVTGLARRK